MKSKPNQYSEVLRSCREQQWSLRRLELELRRYYIEIGQYPKDGKFIGGGRSTAVSWIRWAVREERWRRIKERTSGREKVQRQVQRAVANGSLKKPLRCESCQRRVVKSKLQGHHRDYRNPLRVIWLCQSCHVKVQGKRAIKRAAFYARQREMTLWYLASEEKLRRRYKAGQLSRRRYQQLRRELFHKRYSTDGS